MNENFLKFREIVKEKNIFDYEVVFVSFSNGFSQQALDAFESESEDIRDTIFSFIIMVLCLFAISAKIVREIKVFY